MKRCVRCQAVGRLQDRVSESSREVSGHVFVAALPAKECTACKHVHFDDEALQRFDLHIALKVADSGISSGEAFRFMRKSIGMRAAELAQLLDLAPETLSRWETEKRAVDRGALALIGNLVRDAIEGRTTTLDGLRALKQPRTLSGTIRIELTPAQRAVAS